MATPEVTTETEAAQVRTSCINLFHDTEIAQACTSCSYVLEKEVAQVRTSRTAFPDTETAHARNYRSLLLDTEVAQAPRTYDRAVGPQLMYTDTGLAAPCTDTTMSTIELTGLANFLQNYLPLPS